jgi:hypothetical protein
MRVKEGKAATAERPVAAKVAPRFTRAAQAERSRLEGKREQLLRKREAAQAEVAQIDLAVSEVDELLELLAPLLGTNGSEPARQGDGTEPDAEPADQRQPAKE